MSYEYAKLHNKQENKFSKMFFQKLMLIICNKIYRVGC